MNVAVLAAWLRQIGKFLQRADVKLPERITPPQGADIPEYAPYTAHFIRDILPMPEELLPLRNQIADMASSADDSRESLAISAAAALAAGLEAGGASRSAQYGGEFLESIFGRLRLGGRGLSGNDLKYPLCPLVSPNAIFPTANPGNLADYSALLEQFAAALQKIPVNYGVGAWHSTLVSLLERYCWCIPATLWDDTPDISLYDHSAATAAIAQAILSCPEGEERFLLFGGDLSGIQTFIFGREETADKGAVRILRGRSFLLQCVTRSIWLELLGRLGLDFSARIMDAGGRFALLLPDTEKTREELGQLQNEVEKWLLETFLGYLRLNMASLAIGREDLARDKFAICFEQFNEELEKAKLRPFHHAFATGLLPVLPTSHADYAEYGECAYCHNRPGSAIEEGLSICSACSSVRELGRELPDAEFVVFTTRHDEGNFANLLFGNMELRLCRELPSPDEAAAALQILSIRNRPIFTVAPIAGHIPRITREDLEIWEREGRFAQRDGKLWFDGDILRPMELKTFGVLADLSRRPPREDGKPWTGQAALGICKADVDNLGLVFSMGFGSDFSVARYTMLARMLNHFFSGWLMERIRRDFPNIYVVFAGGDDVFVIGPWEDAIAFGLEMEKKFREFCGGNPAITISAGLPLVKAGLPMRAIREEAENWLEKSKGHDNGRKNAATIFNISAHWDEAGELLEKGRRLAELCEEGFITRGFLRRLLGYARECQSFVSGEKLAKNGLYQSHFQYDLARNWQNMANRGRGDRDGEKLREEMQKLPEKPKFFAKTQMGSSWAIYRTRIS